MSRAIDLNLPEAVVTRKCNEAGVGTSAIEALPSGGTRIVCKTSEGADEIRLIFRDHLLPGRAKRATLHLPG